MSAGAWQLSDFGGREPGTNTGHGHVWQRPDGMRARCGGPRLCRQCAEDEEILAAYEVRNALPAALASSFTPTELQLIAAYLTQRAVEARATSRADEAAALRRLGDAVEEAGRRSAGGT